MKILGWEVEKSCSPQRHPIPCPRRHLTYHHTVRHKMCITQLKTLSQTVFSYYLQHEKHRLIKFTHLNIWCGSMPHNIHHFSDWTSKTTDDTNKNKMYKGMRHTVSQTTRPLRFNSKHSLIIFGTFTNFFGIVYSYCRKPEVMTMTIQNPPNQQTDLFYTTFKCTVTTGHFTFWISLFAQRKH